jgi:branched-chain amino acid aminotransferase
MKDLFGADEAFFCGTAVEVIPVVKVIDASVPGNPRKEYTVGGGKIGPVTQAMIAAYREAVTGKAQRYEKWLTLVNE